MASVREIIHHTAAAIRELRPHVEKPSTEWQKVDEILSKEDTSQTLLSAVNATLQRYGEPPVEKVNGYDILVLDEILEEESVCQRCRDPQMCPYRGIKVKPRVYPQGIFAEDVWCKRHYRAYLISEIQELAQKDIAGLEAKDIQELLEIRRKLKARRKS